jgi:hypothetical protein
MILLTIGRRFRLFGRGISMVGQSCTVVENPASLCVVVRLTFARSDEFTKSTFPSHNICDSV